VTRRDHHNAPQETAPNYSLHPSKECLFLLCFQFIRCFDGIVHYERDGEIKIGDTALDSPSNAEAARQERMKREG